MKFRTKWSKAIYIIRPSARQVDQLGIVNIRPGLRAIFDRDTHEFDSVLAQEEIGWSDEEREAVEKFLLNSKDYGNGLILSPGQEIPEDWNVKAQKHADPTVTSRCQFIDFVDGDVRQCENQSLPSSDKCEVHTEKKGKVIKDRKSVV